MTRRGSSPVFVGRREELGRLDSALARAALGQPTLVLMAGDAGVGKSRLAAEFAQRAEAGGALVTIGGCLDVEQGGLPYAPFVEAFRGLSRRMDQAALTAAFGPSTDVFGVLAPGRRRTSAEDDGPSDPAGRLARLFDAVIGTLGRASDQAPLVLVLEDLHWADGSTRDLVRFVVRNMRDERMLIVATYRTDDLHRRHPLRPILAELDRAERVERIDLRSFDREELREQLAGILGQRPRPAVVEALFDRSDGLPFYVEELVADGRMDAELPSTLRDILGSRLAALSPGARSVVRAAAVVGDRVPHDRLAAAFGDDDVNLMAGLDDAVEAGILVPGDDGGDPGYRFRHALLREAAYDDLLPAERVRLHARLADDLEVAVMSGSTPDPWIVSEYALHAYQAHDQPRALAGSVKALQALVAAAAYREALGHAERAIELWPRVEHARERAGISHVDLLAIAARISSATNHPERAAALLQAAVVDDDPEAGPDRRAELLATLYEIAWEAEDFEASAAAVEEAHALIEPRPASRAKAFVLLTMGWHYWYTGRLRESLRLLEESAAMSEALGDMSAWTTAISGAAHTLFDLGRNVKAATYVDRLVGRGTPVDERPESLMADVDRSMTLWAVGRFDEAVRIADIGLARATRYGWERRLGSEFRGCLADAFFELGRYDEVETMTRPAIAGDGIPNTISWASLTMTRASVTRGRLDAAHRLLDGLKPEPSMAGCFHQQAVVELARADDRFDIVIAGVESAVASDPGNERVTPLQFVLASAIGAAADRAVVARRRRRPGDAAEAADQAVRWIERLHALVDGTAADGGAGPFVDATLATADAEMTRLAGANDPGAWRTAVDRWSAVPQRQQGAYAAIRLAEVMLDSGADRDHARSLLRSAVVTASSIGAEPLVAEARSIAQRARLPLEDVDAVAVVGSDRAVATLTGRERDVIRLVAAGHTNREIGDRLFISEKTVSVHVSNAMAKLGALSRYEAAATAEQEGLL